MLILKDVGSLDELLQKLIEAGVSGGTFIEGKGMANALVNMEDLPMFGGLRQMLSDEEKEVSNIMMFVLKDDQVMAIRSIIKNVIGDLNKPNTGIMFSIPLTYVEGLGE